MVYAYIVDHFVCGLRFTNASAPAASGMPAFTCENGITVMRVMDATSSEAEIVARQATAITLCALSTMKITGNVLY